MGQARAQQAIDQLIHRFLSCVCELEQLPNEIFVQFAESKDSFKRTRAVVSEASPPNLHDDVKLFKDGEPATIDDIGLLDLWPIETGDTLDVRIGWRFKGLLDDLRIYDRALSEDEIKALFKLEGNRPLAKPQ